MVDFGQAFGLLGQASSDDEEYARPDQLSRESHDGAVSTPTRYPYDRQSQIGIAK